MPKIIREQLQVLIKSEYPLEKAFRVALNKAQKTQDAEDCYQVGSIYRDATGTMNEHNWGQACV